MLTLGRIDHAAEWDALVADSPSATPFHRWDWLSGHAALNHWRFEPLVVVQDGRRTGVLPLLLTRRGPVWREAPVPFPYVGPLVPLPQLAPALAALTRWAHRHRVAITRLDLAPRAVPGDDPARNRAIVAPGHVWEPADTYVVDLADGDLEEFHRHVSRSTLRGVHRAARAGVVVADATREQVETWLPALQHEAFGARGLPSPYPDEVGSLVWRICAGRSDTYLRSATVQGRPAGLLIALAAGDTVFSWAGGGFRAERGLTPNALLHDDLAAWSIAHGYRRLDLVGAVDPGVARFKTSFGATRESFLMGTCTHSRLWGVARQVRDRMGHHEVVDLQDGPVLDATG